MECHNFSFMIPRKADMSRLALAYPAKTITHFAQQTTSSYIHEEVFLYIVCNGFR